MVCEPTRREVLKKATFAATSALALNPAAGAWATEPSDAAAGPAMTRDTIFRVASMVKLITTVAALRLVEQGKLSLEAPVPDIDPVIAAPRVLDGFDPAGKPVLRPAKRPISLHDLLTHTAGFVYWLWD